MSVVSLDQFGAADAWVDGLPLQLAWEEAQAFWWVHPYQFQAPDVFLERTNEGADISENQLDSAFYGANRSWHKGAGQKRLQVPNVSDPYAFLSSKGIDVSQQGQATLQHTTTLLDASSYTTQPERIAVANDQLFYVGTSTTLRRFSSVTGAATAVTMTTTNPTGLTSDGTNVYACDGTVICKVAPNVNGVTLGAAKADILEWMKNGLWGCGNQFDATRKSFYSFDSAGAATEVFRFPAGLVPVQMVELGPLVYIAVQSTTGATSWVYAYDGNLAPFIALPMPDGDRIESMTAFLGAGMLIGATRVHEANATQGIVYVGFPQGQGHLVLLQRELVTLGATDSNSARTYTLGRGTTWGRSVYFPWPYDDASGLGVYFPETAAYSRSLFNPSSISNQIGGVARWRNRMFFTVQGSGLYAETLTYISTGNIVSSLIDINNEVLKLWFRQYAGFDPLVANTSVQIEYSTDNGVTWTSGGTDSTVGDVQLVGQPFTQSKRIQYRVTLATSNGVSTPLLTLASIGGWPIQAVKPEHILVIRAYPRFEFRSQQQIFDNRRGWALFDALATKRANGTVVDYQPPWWRHSQTTLKCRISSLSVLHGLSWGETGDEVGGPIQVGFKEL